MRKKFEKTFYLAKKLMFGWIFYNIREMKNKKMSII
jgi:hypothetical protein